jgi:hypothetical protein
MKPVTAKLVAQSSNRKYYEHRISQLSEDRQQQLETLCEGLEAAGAKRPLDWALSETDEGIPQFARFRVLQELYQAANSVTNNVDSAEYDFGFNATETYETMAKAIGKKQLDDFLIAYGKGISYNLVTMLDEGNPESERDGFSWRLMKTNLPGDEMLKGIDGLHEDFMEFGDQID